VDLGTGDVEREGRPGAPGIGGEGGDSVVGVYPSISACQRSSSCPEDELFSVLPVVSRLNFLSWERM